MTLLIPTEHELGILTADKPLRAILRPMEPQPPEGTISFRYDEHFGWIGHDLLGPVFLVDIKEIPYAPGDVIAWQEEWCIEPGYRLWSTIPHPEKIHLLPRSAATMPESIARFRNTVAECRPVQVATLQLDDTQVLGLRVSEGFTWWRTFIDDWHANNPDHPFASSWAWWIALKGKPDG